MAQIYNYNGRQVYDYNGQTFDAKTAQPVTKAPEAQTRTLDALTQGGGQSAASVLGGSQQGQTQYAPDYSKFGDALMGLMQKYQKLGTKPFAEQGFNAQEEQVKRLGQTPSDLIGAAPSVQSGVRNAAAGALDPTVAGAQEGMRTYKEQLQSFSSGVEQARGFLKDYQEQENKTRDDARTLIHNAFTQFGGGAFDGADATELLEIEKRAGFPKGYLSGVAKTIKERELQLKQQTEADRAAAKATMGGLTANQINQTVNSIAGAFDNEPIVKAYNTTQEGFQTIKSIGTNTKSPADDIAFIYAFAKIMDPNSVVREGEYNTVQRYAQTWADNFGFKAQRIFSNTNFLTADAKQKMLSTLQAKVSTIEKQYQNVSKEYQRQIDDARAGTPRQITDYSAAFSGGNEAPQGSQNNDPLGIR